MIAVLGSLALGVCALLASASWVIHARSGALVGRGTSVALAAWAAGSGAAWVLADAPEGVGRPAVMAVLGSATVVAILGIGRAVRPAALTSALALAAAEAALVGSSLVSVLWVVGGSPTRPSAGALLGLALTTVDITAAAVIVRLPLTSPAVVVSPRHRRMITVGVLTFSLLGVSDGLLTLDLLDLRIPTWAVAVPRGAAFVAAATIPWLGQAPAVVAAPGRPRLARALPYLLVAAAVGAQLVTVVRGQVGPVSIVLVTLVTSALAVVQALALRENARLLRDLEASGTRLRALVENAGDVILGIDVGTRVVSSNAAAARLLHRTPSAMEGMDVADLAVVDDRSGLRAVLDDVVSGRCATGRVELRLAPPATGTAELRLRGVPGGAVANLSDVTDSVQLRDRLERLARYDEMTGLANRSHLLDEVGGWLRAGRSVGVLYADLDGFKAVNDRFGHLCGDGVLIETARRLQTAAFGLRAEQVMVARIGGDEFVLALRDLAPGELVAAAERILAVMRPTFAVADRAVRVGLSLGMAAGTDAVPATLDPTDAGDLLHRADVAMFAAKQEGRFRAKSWDPAMEARTLRRVDIAIGLRRALDSGRLAVAYQPLVRLSDGVVIGVEALVRVAGGDDAPGALAGLRGLVTPAELVAVAEDTGEIEEMGEWVITEATTQAARWRALGHDIWITVNVSVRQMAAEGFIGSVRRALDDAGLPAENLVVEITEGQLLSDQDPAWRAVEQLQAMGVMMMIDDFGSGYSSLAYLRQMPVRGVKLDRALIDDLCTDPRARTVARAVIAAARALACWSWPRGWKPWRRPGSCGIWAPSPARASRWPRRCPPPR